MVRYRSKEDKLINYKDLNLLTSGEIIHIKKLLDIKKEAEDLVDKVLSKQMIPIIPDDKFRYKVLHQGIREDYFIHKNDKWYWTSTYVQFKEVPIDKEEIYKMLVHSYEWHEDKDNKFKTDGTSSLINHFVEYVRTKL